MSKAIAYFLVLVAGVALGAAGCETDRDGVHINLTELRRLYRDQADPQPSRKHVEALLALMSPQQHNDLGVMLERDGRLEEAKQAYEDAIAKDCRFARAYANLGNVHRALGEDELALQRYRQALVLEPGNFDAANNFADLSAARGENLEASIEYLTHSLPAADAKRAYGLDTLGWLQHLKGAEGKAEKTLLEALGATDPSQTELRAIVWGHLAQVYGATGRPAEAAAARRNARSGGGAPSTAAPAEIVEPELKDEGR